MLLPSTNVNGPVSLSQRGVLVALIALFVTAGTMRLNDCDLFNPDSPRYLIYSQSIVNLGAYRATDLPGAPLYSWRPPGLSLLLAPIMRFRPYDVVAAKVLILICAVVLLWVVFLLAKLHCDNWASLILTAVVASSPMCLMLSTEVLSEIPYTLGVLTVLYILTLSTVADAVDDQRPTTSRVLFGLAIAALAFTPWLRTAGVALVVAVGIWSLMSKERRPWLIAVATAIAGLMLLAWRNKLAAGENYVGSMFSRMRERGLVAMTVSGWETIQHYLTTASSLVLPGFSTHQASYSPLSLGGLPDLGLPAAASGALTALLVILAIVGMWTRRSNGGSLALTYMIVYCGCLVVWPWRHERFLWPLIPVAIAFVPVGFAVVVSRVRQLDTDVIMCGSICLMALAIWQAVLVGKLVQVNLDFLGDRATFHATEFPGFYFSNWRRAGTWLDTNSPRYTRTLTWHAAVGETSHRFQRRVQFEALSPEKIRQQIEQFGARYLVVPNAQFGDGFGWQQTAADPNITLDIVYREQDVAVLEVVPNRTGSISKAVYNEWLDQQLKLIGDARKRKPNRVDLAIRHASLLGDAGQTEQAISILKELFNKGVVTVRLCSELGWLLFDAENYVEAARFLDIARTLPNAESIADQLSQGIELAQQRLAAKDNPQAIDDVDRQLRRVKSFMNSLKFAKAEREADRLLETHPNHPELVFVRGKIHHRLGEVEQAGECYARALELGFKDAAEWLFVIRLHDALQKESESTVEVGDLRKEVNPTDTATHLFMAKQFADHGWTGRALATLEEANTRFPDHAEIQLALADSYRRFGLPEKAMPLLEALLKSKPDDEPAKTSLFAVQRLLVEPRM